MFSYFRGTIADIQKLAANRVILTLDVNGVGYELQVLPRLVRTVELTGEPVQIYAHLNVRDDNMTLFGFGTRAERDLFRQLISVSGIGPQLAIALLDTLELEDLVQAIVTGNTRLLSRTPGVGKKTAERIALELKAKLTEWRSQMGVITTPSALPADNIQEDVELTLLALGYSNREIQQALQAVGQQATLSKSTDGEAWIRAAIAWLSLD